MLVGCLGEEGMFNLVRATRGVSSYDVLLSVSPAEDMDVKRDRGK